MKNYTYNGEQWIERIHIEMTDEQKAIMEGDDQEAKTTSMVELKEQREKNPTASVKTKLNKVWNAQKPEGEISLIAFDVTDNDGEYSGICNYRVGGNHLQKRF